MKARPRSRAALRGDGGAAPRSRELSLTELNRDRTEAAALRADARNTPAANVIAREEQLTKLCVKQRASQFNQGGGP